MSLIRYQSYPISTLQQQINRMFDQFGGAGEFPEGLGGGTFAPAMDVRENIESYEVSMELPGVRQEDVNISLENNVLTVSGSKEQRSEQNEEEYRRVERSYGSFTRSITLPRNVDVQNVTAALEDGVLTIRLPKSEESKPRQISIGNTVQSGEARSGEAKGGKKSKKVEVQGE